MKTINRVALSFLMLAFFSCSVSAGNNSPDPEVRPGLLVFKVSDSSLLDFISAENVEIVDDELSAIFEQIGLLKVEQTFPGCTALVPGGTDLTWFFTARFSEKTKVSDAVELLNSHPGVLYAEPRYFDFPDVIHNDQWRRDQYGLDLTDANLAHDIATGNRNVPVAIVDTGCDMDHPDLVGNLWINPGEDLNGDGVIQDAERNRRDDDNNGMVDDFSGWDFVDRDNFPEDVPDYENPGHGTHVAGIASAMTNNEIGVASIGYNCGLMIIRAGSENIPYGYEGITYAARTGAKVINCSWGGGGYSQWAQDVINYAWENDALVVASAGNDNNNQPHYPSAYNHVLSVAATTSGDLKASFSCYGNTVDVSAPGYSILSTVITGRYGNKSGTSMSSPFTAGLAGLIRATYPQMSPDQASDMILDGADDIDDLNPGYRGLLGTGRINAYRSLALGPRPILSAAQLTFSNDDNGDGKPDRGETAEVSFTFSNERGNLPAENLVARLATDDPSVVILRNEANLPDIDPGEVLDNSDAPFLVEFTQDSFPHTSSLTVTVISGGRINAVVKQFEIIIGHPDILVIDDDDGMKSESYYLQTLGQMNCGWVKQDVARNGSPDPETMVDYSMVIWLTGEARVPLDGNDRTAIEEAAAGGANILLTGKRIGDDPENRNLLRSCFGAVHAADSVYAFMVNGLSGGVIYSAEDSMFLFGYGGAPWGRSSPSAMTVAGDADSLLIYRDRYDVTGLAGVYREDEESSARLVYVGFGFECISDVMLSRSAALSRLYDWFRRESSVPAEEPSAVDLFRLAPAFPNPFNSATCITFAIPGPAPVSISLFDPNGRLLRNLVQESIFPAGEHSISLPAGQLGSGTYFLRVKYGESLRWQPITLVR